MTEYCLTGLEIVIIELAWLGLLAFFGVLLKIYQLIGTTKK